MDAMSLSDPIDLKIYLTDAEFRGEGASIKGMGCACPNASDPDLLVAAPWLRQAAGEDFFLHEGRRSDLRGRLLQGMNAGP
jgi:hypothetical protein